MVSQKNRMLLFAIVKAIEIVGEAASKVSGEQRSASAEIPWRKVIGMRHQLTHGYFDWDLDVIWEAVQSNLPALIPQLENLFEPKAPSNSIGSPPPTTVKPGHCRCFVSCPGSAP